MKRNQQISMAESYITTFKAIETAIDNALRESQGDLSVFRDRVEDLRTDFDELRAMRNLLCSDGNVDHVLNSCSIRYDHDRRLYVSSKRKTLEEVRAVRRAYMKRYYQTEHGKAVRKACQKRYRDRRKEEALLQEWKPSENVQLALQGFSEQKTVNNTTQYPDRA